MVFIVCLLIGCSLGGIRCLVTAFNSTKVTPRVLILRRPASQLSFIYSPLSCCSYNGQRAFTCALAFISNPVTGVIVITTIGTLALPSFHIISMNPRHQRRFISYTQSTYFCFVFANICTIIFNISLFFITKRQ